MDLSVQKERLDPCRCWAANGQSVSQSTHLSEIVCNTYLLAYLSSHITQHAIMNVMIHRHGDIRKCLSSLWHMDGHIRSLS